MAVDPDAYRQAIGRLVTGVTVVTTLDGAIDHAMTANAVTSVSLDPVMLLLCVEQDARFHDAVTTAGVFGVSILDVAQRPAAAWLATRGRPLHGQLDRIPFERGESGVALLKGSLATIECQTAATYPAGDHSIVLGNVTSLQIAATPGEALVYFRGQFGSQR
ncbi:flavin reductase family protein [Calidifontibacter terrae]